MSGRKCPVCGASMRKGARAYVADGAGDVSMRIVCARCTGRAVVIVPHVAAVVCGRDLCKREPELCEAHARELGHRMVVEARSVPARRLRGILDARKREQEAAIEARRAAGELRSSDAQGWAYDDGFNAGLEQAISILESGRD